MGRTSQIVQVGKRRIDLSNLKKVIYPKEHIVKAEVIEYYFKIAPTILRHIKGRPLSLVRFPNGITGERFFQKNRPDWAPDWVEYVTLGTEKKDYILATEQASLVWLANLACLELHQMHAKKPNYDKPDYMVFDLDPPAGYDFKKVAEFALELKPHLESYGYTPFVKTTGGKGIHVLCPIEVRNDFHKVFEAAQHIAKSFVEKHSNDLTLHIRKESRKGRVLVDIYRIRSGQSIVSPYSLRGNPGAPVSMPLLWDTLEDVTDPTEFNINTAVEHVLQEGDAWEAMPAFAVPLHTERKALLNRVSTNKTLKPSRKHKTPEQLEHYSKKRDFQITPEPKPFKKLTDTKNTFVVHRHHASRLHYDLRLEQDGVLKCWSVPKGLPPNPGIKRLAVATEDHPLEYLTFEGTIPKGQYGAGNMWVFASGKYEITKQKKDGFYFCLNSPQLNAEYRMHRMKENEWLLERVDNPQIDWLHDPIEPMLAQISSKVPESDKYLYEIKWDGIRVLISLYEGTIAIQLRSKKEATKPFPELLIPEKAFRAATALFDGEIVCLDEDGKPDFQKVIDRLRRRGDTNIETGRRKFPVNCYIFDCLYLDGRPIINEPLSRRRQWMEDAVKKDTPYRISEMVEDGKGLFAAAREHGLEGIMAKDSTSKYLPGKRSDFWLKIKVRDTTECLIIGYTKGKGERAKHFGALHLGEYVDGQLQYRGKVGSGFNQNSMNQVLSELRKLKKIPRPVKEKPADDGVSVWVEPILHCEIRFDEFTKDGAYRAPVFLRLRPEL